MTEEILELTESKIMEMQIGDITELSVIFGEDWESKCMPVQDFGKKFKQAVIAGEIPKLQFDHTSSDNHAFYERVA